MLNCQHTYFTKEISIKGCFIPGCQSFKVQDRVNLAIDLPGFGHVILTGEVRHLSDNGMGVLFLDFKDPKAMIALQEFLDVISLCEESDDENGLRWLDA